ncbi:putative polysaccharide biosynthesis protein [Oceanobacillus halotolerans]|uniref:putative polysaccharide biosynthesis protein n=1 Tax=Oceanobacillus halotolerans TaxID=2663380 RepID=UPI0013D9800F|nr:polysaccharide biosynthesis protein [Oceanobacillus halotolerans]
MSKSTFVKSTLILTIATLLSKVLGSIFRIPLQNIAGDEVLGIFSLVYPVYMVALILSVAGIPIAISKLIAEARVTNDTIAISNIYKTASILGLLLGLVSFSLIYGFSNPIAQALGGTETRLALIVVAATLLIAPYMAVYRGFFQGYEDMRPTAISQVIEQFIRVVLILGIAYYFVIQGYTDAVVAGGVMGGSIVGAIASLIYLRIRYNRSPLNVKRETGYSFRVFKTWSKKILTVSIPIAFGTITMALINFVDSFTISYALRSTGVDSNNITYLYGIYGRGLALVQIATVFATSIILPLIPLVTKKLDQQDDDGSRAIINQTHTMTHMISWPAALGLFALTLPLNLALFTDFEGSWVLAIIGISSVFTSFTIVGTGILQGLNLANKAARIIVVGVMLKIFSNIFFIQWFGLEGAALSTLLIYMLLFIINSFYIFQRITFTFINRDYLKMVFASITMGAFIGVPTLFFHLEEWTRIQAILYIIFAILLGAVLYFLQLFMMKVIDKATLKEFPVIGKILK